MSEYQGVPPQPSKPISYTVGEVCAALRISRATASFWCGLHAAMETRR
jgi:hypothetical protein